jgi:hypothetical protein
MDISQIYIAVAIVVLAVVALLVLFANKDQRAKRLTPLASLAFAFVLAGLLFGDNRLVGYSLMGVGVLLATLDIFNTTKR